MNSEQFIDQIMSGVAYNKVSADFMTFQKDKNSVEFATNLFDLATSLDTTQGSWTASPKQGQLLLNINIDLLSALSVEWNKARPALKRSDWRYEMRSVVLILSGKHRLIANSAIESEVGEELSNVFAANKYIVKKTINSSITSDQSEIKKPAIPVLG